MIALPRPSRRVKELPLTAMIDIVFILIFFFMLTTSFMRVESLEVQLPSGKGASAPLSAITRVVLHEDGSVALAEKKLSFAELADALQALVARNANAQVVVYTADGVTLETMVSVLDTLSHVGAKHVYVRPLPKSVTPAVEAL